MEPDLRGHHVLHNRTKALVSAAARFRLGDGPRDLLTATKFALRSVARRYEALSEKIAELEAHLDRLVAQAAPEPVSLPGIGKGAQAPLGWSTSY